MLTAGITAGAATETVWGWLEGSGDTGENIIINASGAGIDGCANWRPPVARWLRETGRVAEDNRSAERQLSVGMMQLVCADVIRPGMGWLLTTATPRNLSGEMARVRDPAGFSKLSELGSASLASYSVTRTAVEWVAVIAAAKGGTVADITVGDCLELLEISDALFPNSGGKGPSFYQLLPLLAAVDQSRKEAAARLEAAQSARPSELLTAGGMTLRRSQLSTRSSRTWAEDPETGNRRDLGRKKTRPSWPGPPWRSSARRASGSRN